MKKPEPLSGINLARMRDKINESIEYTHKTRPINGINTTVDDGPDGRPVNAVGGGAGGGGSTTNIINPPFDPSGLQGQIDAQAVTIAAQTTSIATLQNRLNNATASGRCTGDEIEITISFPE